MPGVAGIVAVGALQVHAFLLKRLHALVWDTVTARCSFEVAQFSAVMFAKHIMSTTLGELIGKPSSTRLRVFRPLLSEKMLSQLVPGPRATAQALLTPALLCALRQMYLRTQIRQSLHEQVRAVRGASVRVPSAMAASPVLEACSLNPALKCHSRGVCHGVAWLPRKCTWLQVLRYPGATMTTLNQAGTSVYAVRLQGKHLGSLVLVYHNHGIAHDRIAVRALPAGWSAVHTRNTLNDYVLDNVSLADLTQLLERYWGCVDDHVAT
jgi:hypothetical protein